MPKTKKTFRQQFTELESIIKKFESDDWNVEEGLEDFERALALAAELKKILRTTENKITELKNTYSTDNDA